MLDPMTEQKDKEIENKITNHSCPYCGIYLVEKNLEVWREKIVAQQYTYDESTKTWIEIGSEDNLENKIIKILCNNCGKDVYIFFYDDFI